MSVFNTIRTTLRLILFSLAPLFANRLFPSDETTTLAAYFDPHNATAPSGPFQIHFPYASPVAAPFILFRLKRTGFSSCRITATDGGLLLTARR